MNQRNQYARSYLHQLRKLLLVSHRAKKVLISGISAELEQYVEVNPQADWDQLVDKFGTPEETAQALLDNVDLPKVVVHRRWKRLALCVVGALILALIIYLVARVIQMQQETEAVVVETITIYDVRETEDPFE